MDSIKIFAPATVANVACGFDIFGLAVDNPGDEVVLRKRQDDKIIITKITRKKHRHRSNHQLSEKYWFSGWF